MELFLMISLLVVALLLVGIILIQQGKGAEMGASFGAGGSNTLFGAPGAGNFLTKSTTILAILFFVIALAITAVKKKGGDSENLIEKAGEGISIPKENNSSSVQAIPSEREISTEIPSANQETLTTEIPTASDVQKNVNEKIDATATDLKDKAKAEADKIEAEAQDKIDETKAAADKKLDDAKSTLDAKANELKDKATDALKDKKGDQ